LLQQGLSDAPDDAPDRLTARRARIDDPAGIVGANETVQPHNTRLFIDADLRKYRREAEERFSMRTSLA
jgi:hypothetical protein